MKITETLPPEVAEELRSQKVFIRSFFREDIPLIVEAFNVMGWNKGVSLFEQYLAEQEAGEWLVWLAFVRDAFAGYVTLKWQSLYHKQSLSFHVPSISYNTFLEKKTIQNTRMVHEHKITRYTRHTKIRRVLISA